MSAYKKWVIAFFALLLAGLALLGSVTVIIDPYFHYHAPLDGLSYDIFYQRYQNDGIVKHFDYDAVITGNSMTENFKSSECDALFGVRSIKVPFSGASLKELDMNLRTALEHNGDIKLVILCIGYGAFAQDKDYMAYENDDYPWFLYDKNPLNDVKYIFNKSILKTSLENVMRTRAGIPTTSFDEYSAWPADTIYCWESAVAQYERPAQKERVEFDKEKKELLRGNIEQNLIETACAHPDTEFYYFIPPYSVLFFDKLNRQGELEMQLESEKMTIEMLLELDNVRLFSFIDDFELVTDFSHYKDYSHYDPGINSHILECMASGEHELTKENYADYCARIREFYTSYDYEALFE